MATGYEVFGPCAPQVGTGNAGAYELLGDCADGGTITPQFFQRQIKRDGSGGAEGAPAEIQSLGSMFDIEFDLVNFDDLVLDKLMMKAEGSNTIGQGGVPGVLLGTGGHLVKLYLPSASARPWQFFHCCLAPNGYSGKFGTGYGTKKIRMLAIRYLPGTTMTAAGVAGWSRVAPS